MTHTKRAAPAGYPEAAKKQTQQYSNLPAAIGQALCSVDNQLATLSFPDQALALVLLLKLQRRRLEAEISHRFIADISNGIDKRVAAIEALGGAL
jgi:hypothetical protein